MYEMEGPRPVSLLVADSVARARASRRDIRPADLADRLPGRRLRRDSRLATLIGRLPDQVLRRDGRRAALVDRLPGRLVRRDVRPLPWQTDCSAAVCRVAPLSSEPKRVR